MKKKLYKSTIFGLVALVLLIISFIFFIFFMEFMWDDVWEMYRVKHFEQEVVIGDFICQEFVSSINLKGLSEYGKLKSHIIIPQTINDKKVSLWGYNSAILSKDVGKWESENLKKIYVVGDKYEYSRYTRGGDVFGKCPNLEKIIFINKNNFDLYSLKSDNRIIFVNDKEYCNQYTNYNSEDNGNPSIYVANVSYYYNYEDAPNDGFYWLDDIEDGELIDFIPEDPKREGYIFEGWYKEESCINKFNFGVDRIQKAEYYTEFIENKLYAKWAKE